MNDGLDELRNLLSFNPTRKPNRKRRGARKWHWDKNDKWKHHSSHWDKEDALKNTPTEPGTYWLVRGSHGSFIIEKEIVVT